MSIRFAAAARVPGPRMRPLQVRAFARRPAANDNSQHQIRSAVLHAALNHFARHGLAAARVAADLAEAARAAGDADGHAWWLDICRTLDRRLAARMERDAANRK